MALPAGFLALISNYAELAPLATSLLTMPQTSVRINAAKPAIVAGADERVPWCREGFYLDERPSFTFDPALHQGRYYVQDASSMALSTVVRHLAADRQVRYLDACAAPGGKTTAAIAALSPQSAVVANEYDFRRAEILAENIAKWGTSNVLVTRGDTRRFAKLADAFDIVAVDAPCSGEGMMRKEEKARTQWSEGLVNQCADTQREILDNVWPAIAPGGYLIYSTCTFNRTENEENLSWLINRTGAIPVAIPPLDAFPEIAHGIDTTFPCYRFLPGRVRGEGLFLAVVQKRADTSNNTSNNISANISAKACSRRKNNAAKPSKIPAMPTNWVSDKCRLVARADEIYAVTKDAESFFEDIAPTLDVLSYGTHIATVKGKDILPTQPLALATECNSATFANAEIGHDEAIRYLQRETVTLPEDTPCGYVLLTYQGVNLGFVKNLGNRSNNLYPKNWRILSR